MTKQELEMLSKHKQRSENGFDALKQFVIDQKACNSCGTCISGCPKGCLDGGTEPGIRR